MFSEVALAGSHPNCLMLLLDFLERVMKQPPLPLALSGWRKGRLTHSLTSAGLAFALKEVHCFFHHREPSPGLQDQPGCKRHPVYQGPGLQGPQGAPGPRAQGTVFQTVLISSLPPFLYFSTIVLRSVHCSLLCSSPPAAIRLNM